MHHSLLGFCWHLGSVSRFKQVLRKWFVAVFIDHSVISSNLFFVLCSLFSVLCSLFSVLCSLFSVLCFLFPVLCPLFSVLCSLLSGLCSLFSALCYLFSVLYPLFSVLCSLSSVLCSLFSVFCSQYLFWIIALFSVCLICSKDTTQLRNKKTFILQQKSYGWQINDKNCCDPT